MWLDDHVLQNYRVLNPRPVADFHLCANSHIWSNLGTRVDLGLWVDTDQAFDLVRIDILGLRQHGAQYSLVVLHVELLGSEKLVHVIYAQPKVLILVQMVQVSFLSLAKRQQDVFHPRPFFVEHFFNHDVCEFIEESGEVGLLLLLGVCKWITLDTFREVWVIEQVL